jgi:hypothetical protein
MKPDGGEIFEKYLNFMKIRPEGSEVFHANGHDEGKSLFEILRTRLKLLKKRGSTKMNDIGMYSIVHISMGLVTCERVSY